MCKDTDFFSSLTYHTFYSIVLLTALLCYREEWTWLQSHVYTTTNGSAQNLLSGEDESLMESSGVVEFVRSLRAAVTHLLTKLNIPLYRVKMISNHHLKISKLLCYELFRKKKTICLVSIYYYFIINHSAFWLTNAGILKFNIWPLTDFHFHHGVPDRPISMVCTLVSCYSLETICPCCCCCLPVRTSAPVTGLWWGPRNLVSPCPCRSLS